MRVLFTWECMSLERCLKEHSVAEIRAWIPSIVVPSCDAALKKFECTETDSCVLPKEQRSGFVPGDIVARSQIQAADSPGVPYVPKSERTPTPFPPPFTCTSAMGASVTIHPISMAAPREMFVGHQRRRLVQRTQGFSQLYPKGAKAKSGMRRSGSTRRCLPWPTS